MKIKYSIIPLICSLVLVGCTPKRVNSISLNETSITLEETNEFTLDVTIDPVDATNKKINWTTSDKFVATVNDKGLVTGLNEGYATITATSASNPKLKAECEVTVVAKQEKADSEVNFVAKTMKTYHYTKSSTQNETVYFRDDRLNKFPYISLKRYYQLLTNHVLTITKTGDDLYQVISANGEEATINTNTDVLTCADYQNFISSTIYRQDHVPNVYFDGAPFLRVKNVTHSKEADPTTINFKKYNINLFGKDDDIYLPVSTASNMFMGPTMVTCFCTADTMYFIDPNDPHWETYSLLRTSRYQTGISKFFTDGKRTKEDARFSYGELCFLIDTYYGLPGREYLHNELKQSRDLDKVLSEHSDVTRKAKEYLSSTDYAEYLAGIKMLASFISDAGHSVAQIGTNYYLNQDNKLYTKVYKALNSIGFDASTYDAPRNVDYDYIYGVYYARQDGPNLGANEYTLQGDTLFYRMEQFDFDIYDWNKYYKNPGLNVLPRDAVGNFKRMLDAYNDNDLVKNVVVDISLNPGGYADIVAAFMGLMNAPTYQHSYDTINEREITVNYEFDKNFDGVFDEHDNEVHYNYNFAILCSGYSFSCGNLLPAQAKENGIVVLGDQSGGGSCAVIDASSAEGLYVRLSCPDHLLGLDGTDYEFGVPADYKLVTGSDGSYDFSNFYNISLMSQKMNEFYSR